MYSQTYNSLRITSLTREQWYRIYWLTDKSLSQEIYRYGDGHRAAKEQNLGRYRLAPATPNDGGGY